MTSDAATWGEIMPGNACALNEKVEAARAETKIEAVLAIVTFPVMRSWERAVFVIFFV
jgi:hypothetical protein